jgi:hypothetical protein
MSSPTRFSGELNSSSLDLSLLRLNLLWPWFCLTQTQGLHPPLDSDSTSIRTCFLNLLLQFSWTTYPILTRMPYPIASMFIRPYMFIPGQIILPNSSPDRTSTYRSYPATLPDFLTQSFPDRTSNYPIIPGHLTQLPYPAGSPSDAHSVKPSSTM